MPPRRIYVWRNASSRAPDHKAQVSHHAPRCAQCTGGEAAVLRARDSRVLVRQCDGGHLLAATSNERAKPFGSRFVTLIDPLQDRVSPLDEDSAHIDVTPATDSSKLRLAARAMLAGHEAQESREVPAVLERLWIAEARSIACS